HRTHFLKRDIMRKGLFITNGNDLDPPLCRPGAYGDRIDIAYIYDLEKPTGILEAISAYAALLLPIHADQRFLQQYRNDVDAYLDSGGTLIFNGHAAYPFAREISSFVPVEDARMTDYEIEMLEPHPAFEGVAPYDLSFRRGVAGFYGPGSNPPP